jgi:hypothetical protein
MKHQPANFLYLKESNILKDVKISHEVYQRGGQLR